MSKGDLTPLDPEIQAEYAAAAQFYAAGVFDDDEAMAYLADTRGLDMATIMNFGLGVVREPLNQAHERYVGSICIPNHCGAQDEHVVGLKFRSLDPDSDKKYDQPHGQVQRLFNLRALNECTDTVWVTEGEFDAVCLNMVGLPAIGVPGASNWGDKGGYRRRMLEGLRVILCRDSDKAGEELEKAMRKSLDFFVVRSMQPHKDVNEFLLQEGPEALRARAEHGR